MESADVGNVLSDCEYNVSYPKRLQSLSSLQKLGIAPYPDSKRSKSDGAEHINCPRYIDRSSEADSYSVHETSGAAGSI
jgi:hypothetical protein